MYVNGHMRVYVCADCGGRYVKTDDILRVYNMETRTNAKKCGQNEWKRMKYYTFFSFFFRIVSNRKWASTKLERYLFHNHPISIENHIHLRLILDISNFFRSLFFYLTAFCTGPNISFLSEIITSDIVRWIPLNCTT